MSMKPCDVCAELIDTEKSITCPKCGTLIKEA